jgi:DNA-binding PadR family transcriptional regulator
MAVSTLGYAILALLHRQPGTGYDLAQRTRDPISYFWAAQHSQIHPELQRLLADALISFQMAPGPGPYPKKVYSITGAGRRALASWVTAPSQPAPTRSELLLKTYAVGAADAAAAASLYEAEATEHERRLDILTAIIVRIEDRYGGSAPDPSDPDFGNHATLSYGIGHARHHIAWCRTMAQRLRA